MIGDFASLKWWYCSPAMGQCPGILSHPCHYHVLLLDVPSATPVQSELPGQESGLCHRGTVTAKPRPTTPFGERQLKHGGHLENLRLYGWSRPNDHRQPQSGCVSPSPSGTGSNRSNGQRGTWQLALPTIERGWNHTAMVIWAHHCSDPPSTHSNCIPIVLHFMLKCYQNATKLVN